MPTTITQLRQRKVEQGKFSCLTAYDAIFARVASQQGIDVLLVGDSLGMVLQGHDSTVPVTLEQMAYHTECVKRGNEGALIMADMPFMSTHTTKDALDNAGKLMQAGAHIVKIEGGEWLAESIALMSERGMPVCAHLGLTPQSVNKLGGFKVQGRETESANRMVNEAKILEQAGADMLLLECVPMALAERITQAVKVPVIGIGAGNVTDGQVLVLHDLLGVGSERFPKFVKNFMAESESIADAIALYDRAVKSGEFPTQEHAFEGYA